MDIYLAALDCGVAVAPGDAFFAEQVPTDYLRLSWTASSPERVARGLEILADILHQQVARSRRLRVPRLQEFVPTV